MTLADGTRLSCEDSPIHSGAEGELFVSSDGASLVKLYWRDDPHRRQSLTSIIRHYNAVLDDAYWSSLFCWPDGVVIQPRLGVKVPRASPNLRNLNWFVLPKARARLTAGERGNWLNHVGMAIRLSRAIRRLHQLGLCHSDLSLNNCLADPALGSLTLIDLDGLVVPGILPPQVDGTPKYMAPEIIMGSAQPSIYTDLHSLAVLLYQILLFRHPFEGPRIHAASAEEDDRLAFGEQAIYIEHPTDSSNRPPGLKLGSRMLGSSLERLFKRAFVDGLHSPASRPLATQWEAALVRLADCVLPCQNPQCEAKAFPYSGTLTPACPWCGTPWKSSAGLALLDLYRPVSGRPGQYMLDDWQIALRDGQALYEWHVYPDRPPGPASQRAPLAGFNFDPAIGAWVVVNRHQAAMQLVPASGAPTTLEPGMQAAIEDGLRLVLAPHEHGRLAHIRIVPL